MAFRSPRATASTFALAFAFLLLAQVTPMRAAPRGSEPTASGGVLAQTQTANFGTFAIGLVQQGLSATGGNGTYTWSLASGTLPPGLSIRTDLPSFLSGTASAGLIGVATTPGTYNFTLRVTSNGETADQPSTIKITALRLRDTNLPDAFVGATYSYTFAAIGNAGALTFTPFGGIPAGMTLNAAGDLSGTPASSALTNVQFTVSDGTDSIFASFPLTVSPIDIGSTGPAPAVLPNVTQNTPYSTTVTATGGTGGYTYTASGLPGGLSINATTGVISGTTSNTPGRFQVSVTAKDSSNTPYTKRMALTVVGPAATLPTFGTILLVDDYAIGVASARTISVSGGAAPYSWSVSGLPGGVGFRAGSGVTSSFVTPGDVELFGSPGATGTSNVTITATDANGASVTRNFALTVGTMFQTDTLVNGTMGVAYSRVARVVGGAPPYTMALVAGSTFPAGLNITPGTQLVSGSPAEHGFFFPQFTFTDSALQVLHVSNSVSIASAGSGTVTINSGASLTIATTGSPYANQLNGSGGSLIWTLTNGTLPTGLTMSSSGNITGTPTQSGIYTFTIRATDSTNAANFAARVFTLNVTPLTITTSSPLPFGNVGVPYSRTLVVSGGTGPYTWTLLPFNAVPAGLTLAADGTLSGTPTVSGQFTFLGTVTDSASHNRAFGFTVSIYPFGQVPPVVQTQSSNFGTFSVGSVQAQLIASGGDGTYTWSVSGGALPPGLSIRPDKPSNFSTLASAGIIGLATTPGTYNFTLRTTSGGQTFDQASTVKITALTLKDPSPLPDAFVGSAYTYTFTPLNNAGSVTFTPTSGVPAGMTLSSAGVLSGIPTGSQFNVNVNFTINDGSSTVSRSVALTISAIRISSSGPAPGVLPNASQGNPYATTVTAVGGTGSYTWSASNLPNGLSIDASTGLISGTPANAGKFQVGITARDTSNVSYTRTMSLVVTSLGAVLPAVTVQGGPWPDCSFGVPCSRTGTVTSGGAAPFSWSVSGLPQGMSFRVGSGTTSNGVPPGDVELWGTPLETGTFNVQLQVTDANGTTAANTFPLRISTLVQTSTGVTGTIGSAFSLTLRAIGGALPYSVALTGGALPAGLSINASTLVLSGTPQESGFFNPIFTYTDNAGETLRIGTAFTINSAGNGFISFSTGSNLGSVAVGGNVSQQLFASGAGDIVWSLVGGALPGGVSISPGGLFSGTGSSAGVFTFLLKAADANNPANFGQRQFTFTVSPLVFGFTNTLPFANVGTAYNQTLTTTGGTGATTWTLNAGSFLPPGLSFASSGALTGTPTSTGFYSFSVSATDTASHVRQTTVSLRVFAAGQGPVLAQQQSANFGTWSIGSVKRPLIGVNGDGTYTWSVISGALPPGIALSTDKPSSFPNNASAGLIGIATTPGTYTFTLRVSSQGQDTDVPSTMKITALRIKDRDLPEAVIGQPYSYALTALNAAGPVTFSRLGALPSGLSLSAAGVFSGTPTSSAQASFTVTVSDGVDSVTEGFELFVPLVRLTSSRVLPNAVQGTPYTTTITAAGGAGGYTFSTFALPTSTSTGLPTGLTLNSSTGVISGTPTAAPGIYQFYLTVSDANGSDLQRPMTLDLLSPSPLQPFINPQFDVFYDCTVGEFCSQVVAVDKGGVAPFSWSASGLPAGMSVRSGAGLTSADVPPGFAEIFGNPGTLGTFNVQFTVTDALGATSTNRFAFTVSELGPDADNENDAVLGTPYQRKYSVIGGTAPYTVSLLGHSYPAGLTLGGATLSGTPVEDGLFLPILGVGDAAAHVFRGQDYVFVNGGGDGSVSISTRDSLGAALTGAPFSRQLDACCAGTLAWSVIGGALPTGVTLSPGGLLSGTPTVSGVATFLVQAAGAANTANRSARLFTLNVTPMAITTASTLTSGNVGTPYARSFAATGGSGTLTWTLAPFNYLPPGVSFAANGSLSGTPTARGQFVFTVVASDQASHNVAKTVGLSIVGPLNTAPTISAIAAQATDEDTTTAGIAFTIGDAETGAASLSVSATSSNPSLVPDANIVLGGTGTSRTITLTPAVNQFGTSTITVTVSDGALSTATSFLLTVNSVDDPPTITAIGNQTVNLDTATGALAFTIGDIDSPLGTLTVSGSSSNTTLVPNGNIVFAGSGAGRTVTVTPAAGQSGTATITVTVGDGVRTSSTGFILTVNPKPTFSVDKPTLVFAATSDGSIFTSKTGEQVVRLLQNGPGNATWTAASNQPWLTVSPASGSGTANLRLNVVFASGLIAQQPGAITITLTGAGNTVNPIAVTLNVVTARTNTAPQGTFDTPTDGAKDIAGSIAVTGWAVDDVEVTRVRILRDPVAGEGSSPIFIGNAVLVDGARPDVAATFPNLPKNSVAGWGYLMLTNFLPNLGNGTFKLYAIADDADGHSTTLGTKTITCNNSGAVTPTGAIDTPQQGEVVSGTIANFGWVLSPGSRRADPLAGGSVRVVVDGEFLPELPTGWVSRQDLLDLFPLAQFSGIEHALGVLGIDTTRLTNGVHTISWLVIDNSSPPQAAGIGSRYFTVANGSLRLEPNTPATGSVVVRNSAVMRVPANARLQATSLSEEIAGVTVQPTTIEARLGFGADEPFREVHVVDHRATITAEELGRVELRLDGTNGTAGVSATGYLRTPDGHLAPLPIGSQFDPASGAFTWMPGVGFTGPYDFVFVRWSDGRVVGRQEVRIVLGRR